MTRPPYGPGGPVPPRFPPPRPVAPPPRVMYPPPMPYQAPSWHPQPPPLRPRPKSNTGMIVTISLVSVLVVTAGLIGVLALTSKKHTTSVADSGYGSYPTTSPTFSAETTRTTPTTTRTTTTTSSSTSSSSSSSSRTTTPRGPQPVYRTGDNPLFAGQNGTNTTTCNLPRWKSDPQSSANFFTAALPCLEAAWMPTLQRANLPYARPNLAFPSGKTWTSACGTTTQQDAPAFYCSGDSTLYMPFSGLHTDSYGPHPGVYLAIFAHEFGHHIQALSGSLRAAHQQEYDAGPDSAAGLEISRRVELQATCFGGMWFAAAWNGKGSIDDTIVREMLNDGYNRGDEFSSDGRRDHGAKKNVGAWQEQGYTKNRTFQCNTYLAPAGSVS